MENPFNFKKNTNDFIDIENKYDLFNIKEQEVYIWKLIRLQVFQEIVMHNQGIKQIHLELGKFERYKSRISMLGNSLFKNPLLKKAKNIMVINHPRSIKFNNLFIDPYTHYFLEGKNKDEYELLERRYVGRINKSIHSTNSSMDFLSVANKINKLFKKVKISAENRRLLLEVGNEILSKHNVDIKLNQAADIALSNFLSMYRIFDFLIKKKKPKQLFLVVSYGLEPIIAAAQDNGVKVIEFQHGVMGRYHLGYHFPDMDNVPYFPDEIKLFGEFWDQTTALPKEAKKTYYGYPYLKEYIKKNKEKINNKDDKQIIVISQGTIGKQLSEFIYKLAPTLPGYNFKYKLHPGEFGRWKKEYPMLVELNKLPNVRVYENEENLYDLFSNSKFVLGVASTAIFEAIAFKVEPIIIKMPSYEYMNDLHQQYNVPILESSSDVKSYIVNYDVNRDHLNVDIESMFHGLYSY